MLTSATRTDRSVVGDRTRDPAPAVVDLDGFTVQPLEPGHAALVVDLLGCRGNRYVLDFPADADTVAAAITSIAREPWSLPLGAVRDGELVGVATTALANLKSLNAGFTALFVDPPSAKLPLAMMVRHLFWTFPLHRLYAHIPAMDLTQEYVDLLTSVGFINEGRLVDHAVIGGQPFDMVTLGLLRPDFERWCAAHEPRLDLQS